MDAKRSPDPLSSMWDWIAHDVRFYRTRANLTGENFGKIMNVVRATVSKIESGAYKISDNQAAALDTHFNTGGHFARLLHYARLGHNPDWFGASLDYERRASIIKVFEHTVVPGLLQTRDYAHALITAGGSPGNLLDERMARQEIFSRSESPLLWAIMSECALHQVIGGAGVAKAQLNRLLEVSDQPHAVLRVVPRSSGAHVGLDGSFALMTTDTGDVVYAEAPGGGRLVATAQEVRRYGTRWERIGQQALPERLSRDLIRRAMEEL